MLNTDRENSLPLPTQKQMMKIMKDKTKEFIKKPQKGQQMQQKDPLSHPVVSLYLLITRIV